MSTSAVTLPTVLVIAQPDDDAADLVVAALEDRDAPVTRFDTGDFPMSATLAARPADIVHPGWLTVQGRRVDLGAVRSVYRRHPAQFGFPDEMSRPEREFAAMESMFGLGGVLAAQPWRWLDRPSAVADAAYKPRQMRVAAACGLRVPRSLVTNDAEQVRAFAAEVGGPDRLVYKAMHAGPIAEQGEVSLIYTAALEGSDLDRMDREGGVRMCPHLFQEWVDKTHDVRLIAVGAQCFAVAIHAYTGPARTDWRQGYDDLTYTRCDTPQTVRDGVTRYLSEFGLLFGAFDFSVDTAGRWWWLECNPSGRWGWLVDHVELPIADAIVDELLATT